MFNASLNRLLTAVVVCSLLFQSCQSGMRAITEEDPELKQGCLMPADHVQDAGDSLSSGALAPIRADARVSGVSPFELVSAVVPASPPFLAGPFTASSGERVLLRQQQGQWQAVLQGGVGAVVHGRTLPVVGAGDIGRLLSSLQGEDVWSSRSRLHVLAAPHMPSTPCVYVGKLGLLGGAPKSRAKQQRVYEKKQAAEEQAKLTEERLANAEERARLAEERAKLTEEKLANADKQVSLSQTTLSSQAFGEKAWSQYFGDVGGEPSLPADINTTLSSACPFWPSKQVKDTHLLVLIPSEVNGKPYSLDLLSELIQHPKGGGHATQYRNYGSATQKQFGTQSPGRSYWALMTRDVFEGSRSETYANQKALVSGYAKRTKLPYELPGALEAATAILSHHVRSGERLYTDSPWTYTRCREL